MATVLTVNGSTVDRVATRTSLGTSGPTPRTATRACHSAGSSAPPRSAPTAGTARPSRCRSPARSSSRGHGSHLTHFDPHLGWVREWHCTGLRNRADRIAVTDTTTQGDRSDVQPAGRLARFRRGLRRPDDGPDRARRPRDGRELGRPAAVGHRQLHLRRHRRGRHLRPLGLGDRLHDHRHRGGQRLHRRPRRAVLGRRGHGRRRHGHRLRRRRDRYHPDRGRDGLHLGPHGPDLPPPGRRPWPTSTRSPSSPRSR
jgi:hypothetical protein